VVNVTSPIGVEDYALGYLIGLYVVSILDLLHDLANRVTEAVVRRHPRKHQRLLMVGFYKGNWGLNCRGHTKVGNGRREKHRVVLLFLTREFVR
jgi:hypothetical protein